MSRRNAPEPEPPGSPWVPPPACPLAAVELVLGPTGVDAWTSVLHDAGFCVAGPGAPPTVARLCAEARVHEVDGDDALPTVVLADSWEQAARAGARVGARGHLVGPCTAAQLRAEVLRAASRAPGPGGAGRVLGWAKIGEDGRVIELLAQPGAQLPLREGHLAFPGGTALQRGGVALLAGSALGPWLAWGAGEGSRWALVHAPRSAELGLARTVGVAEVGYIATDAIHDIYNAHTYIQLGGAVLQDELQPEYFADLQQPIDDILGGTRRVVTLGNAVRAEIQRRIGERAQRFDLLDIVLEVLRVAGARRGPHLSVGVDVPAGVSLRGNPARLREALLRAVQNASEATADLGGWLQISARVEDGWVTLDLDDDGPGFPTLQVTELAEPFQGLAGGQDRLGIGIAFIVKVAGELNGHFIPEVSGYGGARARLVLPLALDDGPEGDPPGGWGDPEGPPRWAGP